VNHVLSPKQELQLVELRRAFGSYQPRIQLHYDRDGEPIDLAMYCVLMEDPDYKHVARTDLGLYVVSTVWLGIDLGIGAPYDMAKWFPTQLFETMVFGDDWRGLDCYKWPTEEAAMVGHEEVVTLVRGTT
jgi:hypothetical protein